MPHTIVLNRIRAEYMEMPGMHLTVQQVQRLCGIERAICQMVLDGLVDEGFLSLKPNGHYARRTDGADVHRPQPAKADLRPNQHAILAS